METPNSPGSDCHVDDLAELHRLLEIVGDLDEIAVRVAEIDRNHLAKRANGCLGAFRDLHATGLQMRRDLLDRRRRNEAKVRGSWLRAGGLGFDGAGIRMQIDLLLGRLEKCFVTVVCRYGAALKYTRCRKPPSAQGGGLTDGGIQLTLICLCHHDSSAPGSRDLSANCLPP